MKTQNKITIKKSDVENTLFCYLRVSSKKQADENYSLEVQKTKGKAIAKRLKMKYFELNEGGSSSMGKKDDYKQQEYRVGQTLFTEIESLIEQGKIKHLWYLDRSRWSRNLREDLRLRDLFIQYQVTVYEGEFGKVRRFNTSEDELFDTIETLFKEQDKKRRSDRSRLGKIHVSKKYGASKSVSLGGVLYGFKNTIINGQKVLVKEKEQQKYLQKMYEMYAKGKSTRDIKVFLEGKGVKTALGNSKWNLQSILKILTNEKYIGHSKWTDKRTGETMTINLERSVTQSLFNKVQDMVKQNQKNKGDNVRKFDSLFGKFMQCGCGEGITSYYKKRTNDYTKTYYCTSKHNQWKGKLVAVCNNRRSMDMQRTDDFLLGQIKEVCDKSHKFKDMFKKQALGNKAKDVMKINLEKEMIQKRIDRLTLDIGSMYDSISNAYLDKALGKNKTMQERVISKLQTEVEDYEKRRSEQEGEIKKLDEMDKWVNWVKGYGKYISESVSDKNKSKILVDDLIDEIIVREVMGESRGKKIQVGHKFDIKFKMALVGDKLIYADENNKSKGYDLKSGRKLLKTKTAKDLHTSKINKKYTTDSGQKKSAGNR